MRLPLRPGENVMYSAFDAVRCTSLLDRVGHCCSINEQDPDLGQFNRSFSKAMEFSFNSPCTAQLLVCVRYCWAGEMIEDFMFSHPMQCPTTSSDVFNVLRHFFSQSKLS